jgi:hypothetical protein
MADTQSDLWEEEQHDALLAALFDPPPEETTNPDTLETDSCSGSSSSP